MGGVQDCAVLGDIVSAAPDDLDGALERYERQRKPDAHALATMDHQVRQHSPPVCAIAVIIDNEGRS